jgi:hypothetical protein
MAFLTRLRLITIDDTGTLRLTHYREPAFFDS